MPSNDSPIRFLSPNSPDLFSPNEPRWYLAYGSNLSASGFLVRRSIKPLNTKVVIVDGLEMLFNNPGVPYLEPRFANCRVCERPSSNSLWGSGQAGAEKEWNPNAGSLLGVAYFLEPKDFVTILSSEGGGTSYQPLLVKAVVLDPEGFRTNETIGAFTLATASGLRSPGEASKRYMQLLRNGAREHTLPLAYQEHLLSTPHYTPRTIFQRVGRLLFILTWMPFMLLFFRLVGILARRGGRAPSWVRIVRGILFWAMWFTHDWFGRWIFGSGERSS